MQNYRSELQEQVKWLDSMITIIDLNIAKNRVSESRPIRTSKNKYGYQYYFEEDGKRIYIRSGQLDTVRKMIQHDYDIALKRKLVSIRDGMNRFLSLYDLQSIENIYNKLGGARKKLIDPLLQIDDEYVKSWLKENPGEQNPYPEKRTYLSEKGEYVRSKSEKILADLFNKYQIPYAYEPALKLRNGYVLYPDFVLLNVNKRKTVYWEHLGLITDEEYAVRSLEKINVYENNGINLGEDLVLSMESDRTPLDIRIIESKIKRYLL